MLKNISLLISASVGAQALTVLFLPVLSRLFDDESFGALQIYMSVMNMLLMCSAVRYEMAILIARTNFQYHTLVKLVSRLIFTVAMLSCLVILIFRTLVIEYYPEIEGILFLVPMMILVGGFYYSLTHIVIRERAYKISARNKMVQASSFIAGALVLGFVNKSLLGLVIADMVSRFIASVSLILQIPSVFRRACRSLKLRHARLIAFLHRDFPIYAFPGSFMSAAVGAIVPLTFFAMFDISVAGQYAIVERFVLLPVGVVAGAAAQVFTGDFSLKVRSNNESLNKTFRLVVTRLFLLGLIPTMVLYYWAPTLVPFIFGVQWELAGKICQIAAPIALVRLVAGPVHMVLVACDRQGLQLIWETFRFLITVSLFLVVIALGIENPLVVMKWYVASVLIAYGVFLIMSDRVTLKSNNLKQNLNS